MITTHLKASQVLRLCAFILSILALLAVAVAAETGVTSGGDGSENRIALVIGNGSYQSVGGLTNPVSDARLMAATLEHMGFQVTVLTDSDQAHMKRGIADFGRALREAGPDTVALFYYAGHAVQSFGINYLLPIDSAIRDQADLDLVGVEAGWVLRQLFSARVKTNIVILDACRNNPFSNVAGFDDQGLAEMNAPTGSFIAYSTAPGSVALDGNGANSPYTQALATEIMAGPQSIEQLFKKVRIKVLESTDGAQTPWESSSLTSDFYFEGGTAPQPQLPDELALWNSVKDLGDPLKLQLYLWAFPQGTYRAEAEAMLAALAPPAPDGATVPAPQSGGQSPDVVTFVDPLRQGEPQIVGKSIETLIRGQPLFPPFEGIPDELWKGQHCTNCHQWNKERICEQAGFYLSENAERSMQKQHPYGVTFKQNLRTWAASGCP